MAARAGGAAGAAGGVVATGDVAAQAAGGAARVGALAPLGVRIFRWLWIAGLISNIGGWMQTVGAQWFLVEQHASPAVIALVSTASAAPVLLFGIPAGVLGEFANRRLLLIGVQSIQALTALALALLTAAGAMTPVLLLALTFALGTASAVQLPAYQAIVPEIVPTKLIANAASLSSIGVNVARAIGPALAGLTIASLGIPFVFALNATSFAGLLLVLVLWRGYRPPKADREPFLSATRAGLRYVAHAGVVRRLYLQLLLFIVPANALWALLPVLADARLNLDSNGYGLLLAALGVGSIGGAFLIPKLRDAWGTSRLIAATSALYGLGIAGVALSNTLLITLPVLVLVGLAWIGVIATLNGTVQSFLPAWVRTRGLSVYQLVLFGGTALGATVAGALGTSIGVVVTVAGAGGVVVLTAVWLLFRPLLPTTGKSRVLAPMPLTDVPPVELTAGPDDGPVTGAVTGAGDRADARASADGTAAPHGRPPLDPDGSTLVIVRYEIADADRVRFLELMRRVEQSRRRTGARTWTLYDDREHPGFIVEAFTVGSWREHLSQHRSRTTGYDTEISDAARALSRSGPVVDHLVSIAVPRHAHPSDTDPPTPTPTPTPTLQPKAEEKP
ncbi:MFS transporter [Herbiconiux sp. VKM Ac-2851]|uniref:MFS transporter n=1 Tax=Herbiconiux sp. VKM Ac-2851 TaxID=2739025 RepID=UPI001564653E|nr:MFS transporter [Herbiconiux sp. VKM Ac-2851]NQX36962.1 MFS transporter [Herbiconiux sp. VKM Ac-2851]